MKGFIKSNGKYYQGDRQSLFDKEVPLRPGKFYTFDGKVWVLDETALLEAEEEKTIQQEEQNVVRELAIDSLKQKGKTQRTMKKLS